MWVLSSRFLNVIYLWMLRNKLVTGVVTETRGLESFITDLLSLLEVNLLSRSKQLF